jgi:hypothetical protein
VQCAGGWNIFGRYARVYRPIIVLDTREKAYEVVPADTSLHVWCRPRISYPHRRDDSVKLQSSIQLWSESMTG